MTKRARIRCINKTDRLNPHERVRNVGDVNSGGSRWKQTQQQTIQEMESGEWQFFVSEAGRTITVVVAPTREYGHAPASDCGSKRGYGFGCCPVVRARAFLASVLVFLEMTCNRRNESRAMNNLLSHKLNSLYSNGTFLLDIPARRLSPQVPKIRSRGKALCTRALSYGCIVMFRYWQRS